MLEEIEASLQRDWDRETLLVYADLLQAQGDPRGTLISLALAGTPDAPRIRERCRAAVEAWLGPLAEDNRVVGDTGFVNLTVGRVAPTVAFLASPLAGYLRRLRIDAETPDECAAVMAALAVRLHPWCAVIEIELLYGPESGPLDAGTVARFFAAMPQVRELQLLRVQLREVPDSIRTLGFTHPRAIASPTCVETVVAKSAVQDGAELARTLGPAWFPRLARLDLADRSTDAFTVFDAIPAPERLSWLRLPCIRDAAEASRLRAIRARLPALALELEVLHRPRAHLLDASLGVMTPTVVPCAPHAAYAIDDHFIVTLPDLELEMLRQTLAYNTETYFTLFSSEQQAALILLWQHLDRLGPIPVGFPGAALARVAETMMLTDFDSQVGGSGWDQVERALASQACSVRLRART